jgi:hypothetical protein
MDDRLRLELGVDNLLDRRYRQPTGGAYLGQGSSMALTGIPGVWRCLARPAPSWWAPASRSERRRNAQGLHVPHPRTFPALLLAAGLTACGGGLSGADLATAQTITFDAAPTLTLGGTAQVSASASSGLAVSFSSLSSTVCSVSSAGRVTAWPSVTAWWPPTRPVTPPPLGPQVTQTLAVQVDAPLAQTLGFDPPARPPPCGWAQRQRERHGQLGPGGGLPQPHPRPAAWGPAMARCWAWRWATA